ncbi:uncharacterized protein LOC115358209 [Myripristis murdjan]|uniref:uncharacterized protein LOC115358209 n=1 Tax=Myripristis murdjan TaxID=586833 RepID=UPI0011760F73|nr:uncharacterized protein LOC115358209 [Myripristis murdjan]
MPAKNQRVRGRKASKGLPPNSKWKQLAKVVSFFLHQDDVSSVINGKAGEIRRKGQIYRKKALRDTMANLHRRFCAEHPEKNVSKAQFFRLRPFWIVRPKVKDRETRGCKMQDNFRLKVVRLKELGVIEASSVEDLVKSSVCDIDNMSCMYGRCQKCNKKAFPMYLDPLTQGNIVMWTEWIIRSVPSTKSLKDGATEEMKETRKAFLEKRTSSIERLLALTAEHLPVFTIHMFNIKHQYLILKAMKDTLTDDAAAVHVDYSENYTCKYASEIKETHFLGNEQVTIHTGVLYLSRGRVEAFASLSSCP